MKQNRSGGEGKWHDCHSFVEVIMRFSIAALALLIAATGLAGEVQHFSPPSPLTTCITEKEYREVLARLPEQVPTPAAPTIDVLFIDPVGGGGMNSPGKTVTNYVDHRPLTGIRDYNCGKITYDTHHGTDTEILSFYDMDEGVAILCGAPGTVIDTHDGEFDRQTTVSSAPANYVIVAHSDGSQAWYWHMRKNSVAVDVGDPVAAGDTLGMIGSSGSSTAPHLHFEVRHGGVVDPFHGPCQDSASCWVSQGPYVMDYPPGLLDHGLSTLTPEWATFLERPPTKTHVTSPDTIRSWLRMRSVQPTDTLHWEVRSNGLLWTETGRLAGGTLASAVWYMEWGLPSDPFFHGNWEIKIYYNEELVATQDFTYDAVPNQLPAISPEVFAAEAGVPLEGEFVGNDPDGSIFWYVIDTSPSNGTLEQYGGRARRFRYTANPGFTGADTVFLYAEDDELAAGPVGFHAFTVTDPLAGTPDPVAEVTEGLTLSRAYPNPFNPSTSLSFSLPRAGHVRLAIHDVTGRVAAVLADGYYEPGVFHAAWDGRDRSGKEMSPGVYFCIVTSGELTASNKIVLMR